MRINKNKRKKFYKKSNHIRLLTYSMLVLFLIIGVGYSALNTDLSINGDVTLSKYEPYTLYNIMKNASTADNTKSEFVSSSAGINYAAASSDNNGKGIYNLTSSNSEEYPVYFYRGDINNNNVVVGPYCFKAVRTSEHGGVKMIYNGSYQNNSCDNSGTDTVVALSEYTPKTLTTINMIAYMYGNDYTVVKRNMYWYMVLHTNLANNSVIDETNYYYSDSFSYSDGTYHLSNPTQINYSSSNYDNTELKYTCMNESTSCETIYYIIDAHDKRAEYFTLSNGQSIEEYKDQILTEQGQDSIVFGHDVSYENGTYTLTNTYTTNIKNWEADYNTIGESYLYTCLTNGTTCTTAYYAYGITDKNIAYIAFNNGQDFDDIKDHLYQNVNNSTLKTAIDNWYSENMQEYSSYLEDSYYCNDRSFINGPLTGYGKVDSNIGYNVNRCGSYSRMRDGAGIIQLTCNNDDKFSVSEENGNGALTYPVAAITTDEAMMAGVINTKVNYLVNGLDYWTMTPDDVYGTGAYVYTVSSTGSFNGFYISDAKKAYVRPYITTKKSLIVVAGDGTPNNPYRFE